jgi:putative tryptophan/tyrosine transport system substrate-binding protein
MRRREFIPLLAGAAATWPFATRAQQADRLRRISVLAAAADNDPEFKARLAAFRQRLEKRGWSEGRNVHIEVRFAAAERFESLAKELVAAQPDVILAHTTPVAAALQRESRTIPVVFVNVSDPVGSGFIESLSRPGGNFTGVLLYEPGIVGKWLAMLKEIVPSLERVALLANPKTTAYDYFLRSAQIIAPSLAIKLVSSPVATAGEIERAIDSLAGTPNSGLLVPPDGTVILHRDLIISLAAQRKMPAIYPFHFFVAAGGLMSYGADRADIFGLAASYVDRILRGDKPADLPVQAPTKFETSVNLRTARALGLSVPPGMLVAADEVLE